MYNEKYMKKAIELAKKAYKKGEIPVGAVIVYKNRIISTGYNKKEQKRCAIKHAEIIAIEKATKKIKNWRLENCDIYVTLEPCPMCASAIHQSRITNVYYGLENADDNVSKITSQIYVNKNLNNITKVHGGKMKNECFELMTSFFKKRREKQ